MGTKVLHIRLEESTYHKFRSLFPHYGQLSRVITMCVRQIIKQSEGKKTLKVEDVDKAVVETATKIVEDFS